MPKDVYIYYSGATDKTGGLLAEALEIKGGKEKPKAAQKIVIGWGAKTKDKVNLGSATVINHPDNIRDNRNKFTALQRMQAANVNVAPFVDSGAVLAALDDSNNPIQLPLIGRTNYHQGGANFFTCLTRTHVQQAINTMAKKLEKKGYFQNYIDVKDEYRLHVVDGKVIYAQKKTVRDNMKEAYVEDMTDKVKRMAEKKGEKLDDKTLKFITEYQGSKIAGADMIIKSNTRGHKFSSLKLSNVNKGLADEAIKAVAALSLQFGAVDCVLDVDDKPWVIEVNTGPGLEGTSFKSYVQAFSDMINNILTPAPKTAVKKTTTAKKATTTTAKSGTSKKASKVDPAKLRMLADMLEEASEEEADAVNAVAARMFGSS